jgi:proteic killer suppression protein
LLRWEIGSLPRRAECNVKRHLTFADCGITFPPVIRSFRNRALRRYFETGDPSGLSVPNAARVGRMLRALDAATRPEHVNLPGFYWDPLQGEARWAIRVTGDWRITFAWEADIARFRFTISRTVLCERIGPRSPARQRWLGLSVFAREQKLVAGARAWAAAR